MAVDTLKSKDTSGLPSFWPNLQPLNQGNPKRALVQAVDGSLWIVDIEKGSMTPVKKG